MIIDTETFTQIALHVRRASDGLLGTAKRMAVMCGDEQTGADRGELFGAVEELLVMNREFVGLERLLRAVWKANLCEEEAFKV